MSSYLAAFVVGEYGVISGKLHNTAPINVYTPLNSEKMGGLALDVIIINYLKNYNYSFIFCTVLDFY